MSSPDTNSDLSEEKPARGALTWLLWIPAAVLIYFLSLGPAIWLHRHTQNSGTRKTIETVYAPLEWAARKRGIGKVIEAYANWWWKLGEK